MIRGTVVAMPAYRLRFLDPSGKFIRGDRIESDSDPEAVAIAFDRHLPVRSELWQGPRLVAKLPPARRDPASAGIRASAMLFKSP